jgi:hypothetical protein
MLKGDTFAEFFLLMLMAKRMAERMV